MLRVHDSSLNPAQILADLAQATARCVLGTLPLGLRGAVRRQDRWPGRAEGPLRSHGHLQIAVSSSCCLLSGRLVKIC